jgi:hypothetical protein
MFSLRNYNSLEEIVHSMDLDTGAINVGLPTGIPGVR